jgi:SOS response regulatory protein OraA/RecX
MKKTIAFLFAVICLAGCASKQEEAITDKTEDIAVVATTEETDATVQTTEVPDMIDSATVGKKNALRKAYSYLDFTAFSYTGLIDQLKFEGFTDGEAAYAVENCGADWFVQAQRKAVSYLDFSAFSYTGLIDQLEYEGFTSEEAAYAADNCGADWNEQAARKAKDYLEYSAFSRQSLIDQLKYEGFSSEQAEYGATQNGF